MHSVENDINMHPKTYENSVGFELVRIVRIDGLICSSFMSYALSNNCKKWTEDPISWSELVNTHKFDTSAVIIGLIKVVVLFYEIKYFAIFLLKYQIFYDL
jgi:hypothetical protein